MLFLRNQRVAFRKLLRMLGDKRVALAFSRLLFLFERFVELFYFKLAFGQLVLVLVGHGLYLGAPPFALVR